MGQTGYKLVVMMMLICFSCVSEKDKEQKMYHESLAREFELKNAKAKGNTRAHDSLLLVQNFKQKILNQIDSIKLVSDSIQAKYEFEYGKLPKKVEFSLMRIEENTNDLRLKIRHSKEAEENWNLFQQEVNNELENIKKILKKL